MDLKQLKRKATNIRKELLTMIYKTQTGHTGRASSCTNKRAIKELDSQLLV